MDLARPAGTKNRSCGNRHLLRCGKHPFINLRHLPKCNPNSDDFSYTWLRMLSQEPFHLASQPGSRADIRITKVTGPLTIQHVFAFQDELRKDPTPFNVIDLAGVAYLDSAGMGAIINFYVSCQKG